MSNQDTGLQKLGSSSYYVEFPDFPEFTTQPRKLELIQKAGNHEIVVLTYHSNEASRIESLKTGTLLKIKIKAPRSDGQFIGYVSNVNPEFKAKYKNDLTVTAIAASFPFKEKNTEVWVNQTANQIIKSICKKYSLKLKSTAHPMKFPQIAQRGRSYWEVMKELSDRTGYVIHVEGGTVFFMPLDDIIEYKFPLTPVMLHVDPLSGPTYDSRTLHSFEPNIGEFVGFYNGGRVSGVSYGINPNTGAQYKYKSKISGKNLRGTTPDTLFIGVETTRVAHSIKDVKATANAISQKSRFSIPAKAVFEGDPRVLPYQTVEIAGLGKEINGYWVVIEAHHTLFLQSKDYKVNAVLVADGTGENSKSNGLVTTKLNTVPSRKLEVSTGKTGFSDVSVKRKNRLISKTKDGFNRTGTRWISKP